MNIEDNNVSSSSSSPPPQITDIVEISQQWLYDVFLSFRGEDTRKSFVDHLYTTLHDKGIHVFRDDIELRRGTSITPELRKAIEKSRFAVVIFSKNYAESSWCVEELTQIVECNKKRGQTLIPVFYSVDPSIVRKQEDSYKEAFAKHEKNFKGETEKIQRWRDALKEAASISGYDIQHMEDGRIHGKGTRMPGFARRRGHGPRPTHNPAAAESSRQPADPAPPAPAAQPQGYGYYRLFEQLTTGARNEHNNHLWEIQHRLARTGSISGIAEHSFMEHAREIEEDIARAAIMVTRSLQGIYQRRSDYHQLSATPDNADRHHQLQFQDLASRLNPIIASLEATVRLPAPNEPEPELGRRPPQTEAEAAFRRHNSRYELGSGSESDPDE